MLEPQDRRQLLESLRPPSGYSLGFAVGTTYSLDLLALLTTPLAFTFFDWEDESGRPSSDPKALLAATKRSADRISIFCQAGQILVPPKHQVLYGLLEDRVFEVTPKHGRGVFHPKVWVLRYTAPGWPVIYRLLCMSRNLTFDRSWDSMLVLDGVLEDRTRVFARNRPLSDFVAALPRLALRPVPGRVQEGINRFKRELLKVRFELPTGFNDVRFWPLGIDGARQWPFTGRIDRMLVISPYASADCLNETNKTGHSNVLVSRLETLDALPRKCLDAFGRIYCLTSSADPEEGAEESDDADRLPLAGLHAKVYVADGGRYASIWTGSANATNAAFHGNVEFLAELVGTKKRCGVAAVLRREKGRPNLVDLLESFEPSETPRKEDEEQRCLKKLKKLLLTARTAIVQSNPTAQVAAIGADGFAVTLRRMSPRPLLLPRGVSVKCRPISLPTASSKPVPEKARTIARFAPMSMLALTGFFAFEMTAKSGVRRLHQRFVLNTPMENCPETRKQEILNALLQNQDEALRFLMMMLIGDDDSDGRNVVPSSGDSSNDARRGTTGGSLFEALMRALDREPEKIDHAAMIIEDLNATPNGRRLLPEGFHTIWEPIRKLRGVSQP
ncbi:MAG: phospholipase D family protein [Verrucomicrobiae bacterium]|nr:phospholipase D family protein [Verrucomicrobiae bacterium]